MTYCKQGNDDVHANLKCTQCKIYIALCLQLHNAYCILLNNIMHDAYCNTKVQNAYRALLLIALLQCFLIAFGALNDIQENLVLYSKYCVVSSIN